MAAWLLDAHGALHDAIARRHAPNKSAVTGCACGLWRVLPETVLFAHPSPRNPTPVNTPPDLELLDGFAVCRIAGEFRPTQAVQEIVGCIARARAEGHGKLLLDVRQMRGFDPPSASMRIEMVRQWAEAAGGAVRIAMIARRSLIDDQKLGVVAGRNFGLNANIFESDADARFWLCELVPGGTPRPA